MVLPNGKDIVDVVSNKPGPKSDISIFNESKKNFEPKQNKILVVSCQSLS
ncbi:hypothetical protein [Rivularia sp. UHCC 0363]|nr:hypothetical protein [Rivularia sp. UHCC 0363]MEA5597148.1 hypothetical protein [Rivularia sp. UHCC 0363]